LRIRHLMAMAALLALLPSIDQSAAVAPIGRTVKASNTVQANGAAGARVLKPAAPVFFNDLLKSNATGYGQFEFVDGTKMVMGPSASIVIDKFVYKGGKTVQKLGIEAAKGAFRFISGQSPSSAYQIVTPSGTMGIRGTAFDFTVRNGKTYVVLLKGNVRFCGGGSCKTLKRSCDFIVASGGQVSDPSSLSKGMSSQDASRIFPLLANQTRLSSGFRQPGRSCLSKMVKFEHLQRVRTQQQALVPPSEPEPPAPAPSRSPNNGFGNGPETGDLASDSSNPGRGHGGPHANQANGRNGHGNQ
jgi:hypothetical protein